MKLILNTDNVIIQIAEKAVYAHVVGEAESSHWEECSEEIARQDYTNRIVSDTKVIDGGILLPDSKMIIPFAVGVTNIVDTEVPTNIVAHEYKYENNEFIINKPVRIKKIQDELEELDNTINRATEDLYVATNTIPYEKIQTVIDRKKVLRDELATL